MNTRPRVHTLHLNFKLTPEMGEAIRDYRAGQGISTEGEALRRLIDAGLKAVGANGSIGIEIPDKDHR